MKSERPSFRKVVDGAVQFTMPLSSPCPCGSKKPASNCCLTPSGFHKDPARTSPPPPFTKNSHTDCYAASLADCSAERSREHYVSESLLRELNRDDDLRVGGFPWQGEREEETLPPAALASHILCTRHNGALSLLDTIAVRLFRAFDDEGASDSDDQDLYLFSGHDVERLLLKILCGLASSGSLTFDRDTDTSIPSQWV